MTARAARQGSGKAPPFHEPLTAAIARFLVEIGLEVRTAELLEPTFLPGLTVVRGALLVDESRLTYPGDLLHEAGHLAVLTAEQRAALSGNAGPDGGDEMTAIAWSYAALLHLGLAPEVVFHAGGYRGGAHAIIENFAGGHTFGVPLLHAYGMSVEQRQARALGLPPYPHMLKWLRD